MTKRGGKREGEPTSGEGLVSIKESCIPFFLPRHLGRKKGRRPQTYGGVSRQIKKKGGKNERSNHHHWIRKKKKEKEKEVPRSEPRD